MVRPDRPDVPESGTLARDAAIGLRAAAYPPPQPRSQSRGRLPLRCCSRSRPVRTRRRAPRRPSRREHPRSQPRRARGACGVALRTPRAADRHRRISQLEPGLPRRRAFPCTSPTRGPSATTARPVSWSPTEYPKVWCPNIDTLFFVRTLEQILKRLVRPGVAPRQLRRQRQEPIDELIACRVIAIPPPVREQLPRLYPPKRRPGRGPGSPTALPRGLPEP